MKLQAPHRRRRPLRSAPKHVRHPSLQNKSFPVVGIGASAGGLEAFTHLLRPLPVDTGMAFVLVQHLDPKHKSMLSEILGRETRMPVSEVKDQMVVMPNHVYVIPPNAQMSIRNGVLSLVPRNEARGPFMPIDYFLRSLAKDRGPRAIAVILSGADADGSQALKAIKAGGGIVFAQDLASSKVGVMPDRAAATGLVDFILPPERIAEELVRIAVDPLDARLSQAPEAEDVSKEDDDLAKIYSLLHRERGVDFTYYKQTTLRRRITRRMVVHKVGTLKEYVKILKAHPAEVGSLYDEMLIHVTSFFRDPEAFETLKTKIFPHLMKHRTSKEPLRIWVPGCSTGEEVYSLAICLLEFLGDQGSQTPIQIFATDISGRALQGARAGIYPTPAMSRVSQGRRRRFFTPVSGGFQVSKSIRGLCVFTKQNVVKDPPFSRLDLISCRNMLIYLGPVLQKKVMPIFHYALKTAGVLFLGNSETLGVYSDLFDPLDKKVRVYSKSRLAVRQEAFFSATNYPVETLNTTKAKSPSEGSLQNMQKEADQYVLGKRAPAGVIIDGTMNVVQFRGAIGQYLELVPGAATFHLFKMAKEGLLLELRPAIHKARKENAPVTSEGSRVNQGGHFKNVTIEVVPLQQTPSNDPHFLVLFEEAPPGAFPEVRPARPSRGREDTAAVRTAELGRTRLKKELAATKDYLQSIINEHERVNEELKSANEEALSSNEEFQSANEELETAKEELQATNEETSTLNEDLHNRNLELNLLNNDLVNLMHSVDTPTVILGKDQHIRRLTSAAEKALNMTPTDIGRSIHDLKLTISVLDLKGLIASVLDKLVIQQREIQDRRGHWYLMRLQPYKTLDDTIDGVVLTLSDIQLAKDLQAKAAAWTADLETRVKQRTEELAKSQSALLQSEKLEAVGRLAGGVAHDFNNLMTGILGMTQDVRDKLGPESPLHADLEDVINAAKKAMIVTKQLLAFGRRQVFDPRVLNINSVIGGMDKLLQRLLGDDIDLMTVLDPLLGNVHIDQSSVEQVILNLALNARDAMPKGGKITLQTNNAEMSKAISIFGNGDTQHATEMPPGPYVVLTVTDKGSGISHENLIHIFEPFFTTKGEGKGTGLGLATVYGIVKQSGGSISVKSTLGQGTSFTIYLPRVGTVSTQDRPVPPPRESSKGSETILVTEDEDIVRKVVVRGLQKKGYTVLHASSGKEAVKIGEQHAGPIHLLLTDVIMPGMNGRELAELMIQKRPTLAVLYMSGHDKEIITQRGVLEPGMTFIEKSFSAESLCHKVREVLDREAKKVPCA